MRGEGVSNRLINAVMRHDSVAAETLFARLRALPGALASYPANIADWGGDYDFGERAARDQGSDARPAAMRLDGSLNLARILVGRGRWDEAEQAIARATRIEPRAPLTLEATLGTLPFLRVPQEDLARIRDNVRSWTPGPPAHNAPLARAYERHARLYLLGLLSSKMGEFQSALACADSLRRIPDPVGTAVPGDLEATVRADVAWRSGQPPDRVLEPLTNMRGQVPAVLWQDRMFSLEHARYLRALALLDAGRAEDALVWLDNTFRISHTNVYYRAGVKYLAARALDALSRPAEAREARSVFENLWSRADSPIDLPGAAAAPARR